MTIAQTNLIAKIAAVVAGLGLVAMSFYTFAQPQGNVTPEAASTSTEPVVEVLGGQTDGAVPQINPVVQ